MQNLRIALAQCRQTACWEENERTVLRFLEAAARERAQIV